MRIQSMRLVAKCLVIAMLAISIVPRVEAGISPSEIIGPPQTDILADQGKIQKIIEMKVIRNKLEKFGFTQQEVRARLDQLNEQQIHRLALNIDDLRVGSGGVGVAIAIILACILVVLLLQISGHKIIITK